MLVPQRPYEQGIPRGDNAIRLLEVLAVWYFERGLNSENGVEFRYHQNTVQFYHIYCPKDRFLSWTNCSFCMGSMLRGVVLVFHDRERLPRNSRKAVGFRSLVTMISIFMNPVS